MELDIKKAFRSPFSDKKWYVKLIFPYIMTIVSFIYNPSLNISNNILLPMSIIILIPNTILFGFYIQFQHNEINNKESLLPNLSGNLKDYFIYGIKALGISLIYISICSLIFFGASAISTIAGLISLLAVLILFIACFLSQSCFADKFRFKDSVNLIKIFKLMSKGKIEIFIYALVTFQILITTNWLSKFTNIMFIIVSIIIVIMQLALMNLSAQMYKIAKVRLENTKTVAQDA